jgi:hypothetical protein
VASDKLATINGSVNASRRRIVAISARPTDYLSSII